MKTSSYCDLDTEKHSDLREFKLTAKIYILTVVLFYYPVIFDLFSMWKH